MKIAITGADGQLGLAFQKELLERGIAYVATDVATCDITRLGDINVLLEGHKPTVLINCAAYNLVDEAQQQKDIAETVNSRAVQMMARACQARGIKFVHYSTDYVFDGEKYDLYTEDDAPRPLNVYGSTKLEGEKLVQTSGADYLLLRTSWVFGQGRQNFLYKVSQWAAKNRILRIASDEVSVPTAAEDLARITLLALDKGLSGLYHLTNSGYASRYELAKFFIQAAGLDAFAIPVPAAHFQPKVVRPLFTAMSNQKISSQLGIIIPAWQEGVEKYVRENSEHERCL
ncbi:MAG: dTDP-4-dehydrorhamnose reductase [Candidatus Omnitrophica bacterium]|nr:dTDP-4-dehydrorhamnose reductase [Candidatus Omnitrophota bacterium]